MDFLLLLGDRRPDFPRERIADVGVWDPFIEVPIAGGLLAYTATKYPGLSPHVDDRGITLVAGDPLLDWVPASAASSGRTAVIAERLGRYPIGHDLFHPFHPAAIVRCRPDSSSPSGVIVEVRNDGFGGVPVYLTRGRGFLLLSSSPDLIAVSVDAGLDLDSCREFVSMARVTFPYTFYDGVREVPPGSVTTVRVTRGRVASSVTGPRRPTGSRRRVATPEEAGRMVAAHLAEFFRRLDLGVGPDAEIGCTLSAGLDSRSVLALATRAFPGRITAMTGTPDENSELATARAVAAALGVRHESATWDPAILVERFTRGHGLLVGSHHRWTDAHFTGASTLFSPRVVIGAYYADAMLDHNDGQLAMRRRAIVAGTLSPNSDPSITSREFASLDPVTKRVLLRRARASVRLLGAHLRESRDLHFSVPAGRGLYAAHWMALRREWAQYEPFLSESALSIAIACTDLPGPGIKPAILAQILADGGLAGIPVNPEAADGTPSRAWLSLATAVGEMPEFAGDYRALQRDAMSVLGIQAAAVRMRHLLINVAWADRLVSDPEPRNDSATGRRVAARRPRRRLAR